MGVRPDVRPRSALSAETPKPIKKTPPAPGRGSLVAKYPSGQAMAVVGPIVFASWRVPEALEAKLKDAGKPVPAQVLGGLLLDTGAGKTCISRKAAGELGLKPTRLAKTYGSGGRYELEVVAARLTLRASHSESAHGVSFETEARSPSVGFPLSLAESANLAK